MKIRAKALNKNEMFCCSKNDVKNIFGDNEIDVSFGMHNINFEYPQLIKKFKIKGKIIAWMHVSKPKKIKIGDYDSYLLPSLIFYILKNEEFSIELRKEFVSKILPKIFLQYILHKEDEPEDICGTYNLRVEVYNGEFIIHENIEK